MSKEPVCLIRSTAGNRDVAKSLARKLIEEELAACVSIESDVLSIYRWNDDVVEDDEIPLTIKTIEEKVDQIQSLFAEHHPYDCPELLVIPVNRSSNEYESWLRNQIR